MLFECLCWHFGAKSKDLGASLSGNIVGEQQVGMAEQTIECASCKIDEFDLPIEIEVFQQGCLEIEETNVLPTEHSVYVDRQQQVPLNLDCMNSFQMSIEHDKMT